MVEHITPENFEEKIVKSDLPVLIDFWAPWCGPCKMMGPVFEELSTVYEGKINFVKINTEDYPELAGPFGIQGIPTLVLAKDGKEVNRLVGFLPKDLLKQRIDSML
ncbi:thioredoxin [Candidatus Woesearchaeota archaeon]|nr:thioredoxin [Candidatus Woesearchaeota archaeon]